MLSNTSEIYASPLSGLDWRFDTYLKKKKAEHAKHILGDGITDYAYAHDLEHRKKLDSVPGLYDIAKKINYTTAAKYTQTLNLDFLAVGPTQFPEVYQIGCDCAKRLGIGVPNIYISNDNTFNAMTVAMDDVEPVIMIGNLLLERYPLNELKAIIGHECGHIHNYHTTYEVLEKTLVVQGANSALRMLGQMQQILSLGVTLTLKAWSRNAEVTADRAAMICADSPDDAYNAIMKMTYGAAKVDDKITTKLDLNALKEQMQMSMNNVHRLYELYSTHPLSIKRIFAMMEFAQCDTFYSWRPDLRQPGQALRSKAATDERCKQFIRVDGKGVTK